MRTYSTVTAFVALLIVTSSAYDGFPDNLTERLGVYMAPGQYDSRGPCPGLNTLANHGLINRNGSNILSQDLFTAFNRGFGISNNSISTAVANFEVVCQYANNGEPCPTQGTSTVLTNLTLLGEPHAFEHDHSYSRQDYKQAYANGAITDNIYFNLTEFGPLGINETSGFITGSGPFHPNLLTPLDLNAIRLQRVSNQYQQDFCGSFQFIIPTQLFETGFIVGATFNRNSTGDQIGPNPLVRTDWWRFWFEEESFPTQLGWVPASTEFFDQSFILVQSSTVLATLPASLPSPLPPGATNTTAGNPTTLPTRDPSSNPPLFSGTAYVAPTNPSAVSTESPGQPTPTFSFQKRDAGIQFPTTTGMPLLSSIVASIKSHEPQIITSALSIAGPPPPKYNLYEQQVDINQLENQIALALSYESKVVSLVTSIFYNDVLPTKG